MLRLLCALFLGLGTLPAWALSPDTLVFDWNIRSLTGPDGSLLAEAGPLDQFSLRADGTFTLQLAAATLTEAGRWHVQGDTLYLQYERLPVVSGIDSLAYVVAENEPSLHFFYQGKEIARQTLSGLESERRAQPYAVRFDERGNLLLNGSDRNFVLYGRAQLITSAFSLMDVVRGLLGIAAMLALCWFFSIDRRAIDWKLVGAGMTLQLVFAVLVLKVPLVRMVFDSIARGFVALLGFAGEGASFLFSGLVTDLDSFGYIFAFQVLPTIVFFSALMSVLYYLGILQRVVYAFAWVMSKTMRLSGAESLAAAGNIFLGQTESPLLVRPYLENMTRSEIMALMTGGMATIAGGVFAAYIGYLGGADPVQQQLFATHLLTASIMSAPAALVAAKMLVPETETINQNIEVPRERLGTNILEAISNGTTDGLKLAVNVGVMLLAFIALMAMLNFFFTDLIGEWTGLNDYVRTSTDGRFTGFNLQYILGLLFSPIAWLLGVPAADMLVVGQLLGEKTILNEFVAYTSLGTAKSAGVVTHMKSVIIATYALCGFANFASIGIQIGGIGALAPNQRRTLSQLGMRALLGGTIAAFLTAAIAGMMVSV